MAVPVFATEIAFGSRWSDAAYVWTDVSDKVGRVGYDRGRQEQLDQMQAGTGSSGLLDDASAFAPRNTASPYYPHVKVLVPIRQTATINGTTYPCFQQFVEAWPRSRQGGYTERQITTVDLFDFLAVAPLAGFTRAAELSGARVAAVLDHVGVPAGRQVISTGRSTVPACAFADDDGTKALQHLLDVADAEAGMFFADNQGDAMFLDRLDMLGAPYNTSQATFSDQPAPGEIMIVDSTPAEDKQHIYNVWTGTRDGGVTQTVQDDASVADFGPRAQPPLTPLLTTDTDVKSLLQFRLPQYAQPQERITSITVTPGDDTAAWETVLALDLGSRITVVDHPAGAASTTDDYLIQHISFPRNPGSDAGARITYGLWPADTNAWCVLDDAVYGLLDQNRLGW